MTMVIIVKTTIWIFLHYCFLSKTSFAEDETFPISAFHGTNDTYLISKFKKSMVCGKESFARTDCCSCKKDCMKTKTCCIDALWDKTKFNDVIMYQDYLISESKKMSKISCIPLLPDDFENPNITAESYSMIDSCPEKAGKVDKDKCSISVGKAEYVVRVLGSDGFVYKNQHCAVCNSVEHFEIKSMNFLCDVISDQQRCRFAIEETKCLPYVNPCEPNTRLFDLCNAFISPLNGYAKYANYFCFLCSGERTYQLAEHCFEMDMVFQSWTYLLEFRDDELIDHENSCINKDINIIALEQCNVLPCPENYVSENGRCQANNRLDLDHHTCLKNDQLFIYILNTKLTLQNYETIWNDKIGDRNLTHNIRLNETNKIVIQVVGSLDKTMKYQLAEEIFKDDDGNAKILFSSIEPHIYASHMQEKHFFSNNRLCAKPILIDDANSCQAIRQRYGSNATNISVWVQVKKNLDLTFLSYSCTEFYLQEVCPLRVLRTKVEVLDNLTLEHVKENNEIERYDVGDYIPLRDGMYAVCDIKEPIPDWYIMANTIEIYISNVGAILSMLCYFAQITISLYLRDLFNSTAGSLIFALTVSLLFADISFLTANLFQVANVTNVPKLCNAIGVIGHFSLLSALYWGVAISYDVCRSVKRFKSTESDSRRKMVNFLLLDISVCGLTIGLSVILNRFNIMDASYAKNDLCSLQGTYGRLIFYAVPLGLSSVLSLTLLFNSVSFISKEKKSNGGILGEENIKKVSLVKVAAKMILITGLAEAIGLLYLPVYSNGVEGLVVKKIIGFLYSFLKGFRGVMLFAASSALKMLISKKGRRKPRPTTNVSIAQSMSIGNEQKRST